MHLCHRTHFCSFFRLSSCSFRTVTSILQDVLLRAEAVHVQAALQQEVRYPSNTLTDGNVVCAAPRPTGGAPQSQTATGAGRRPTTGTAAARRPTSRRRAGAPHPMSLAIGECSALYMLCQVSGNVQGCRRFMIRVAV